MYPNFKITGHYLIVAICFLLICSIDSYSQKILQQKNYPLLSTLLEQKKLRPFLQKIELKPKLSSDKDARFLPENFKFRPDEIDWYSIQFEKQFLANPELVIPVIQKIRKSGSYSLCKDSGDLQLLIYAWRMEAKGINNTIAIYAQGKKPNYPSIDSISFNVKSPDENEAIRSTTKKVFQDSKNEKLFFVPPLRAAIAYLKLNGRTDAADYEPMEKTVNRLAVKEIKRINWKKFPYTLILVPGIGPEDGVSLDPLGKQHCDLAIAQYKRGLAPFIMVSGGKVHPHKTKYCEAEEMKKYLVSMGIPPSAIIMEPHARHTTTNLRNASRLIYKYSIPAEKPAVVITDPEQSAAISRMEKRCLQELGYVPYKLGSRLSDMMQEFYAVQKANQINYTEPLDP